MPCLRRTHSGISEQQETEGKRNGAGKNHSGNTGAGGNFTLSITLGTGMIEVLEVIAVQRFELRMNIMCT